MMEKKCRYCDLVFHKNEHLDRHERTHTKDRPFRCNICNKFFVRKYDFPDTLKRHERLHLTDRDQPSLKRKASTQLSRSPPASDVGHFATHDPKSQALDTSRVAADRVPFLESSDFDSTAKMSASTYIPLSEEVGGLSATEFNPITFDFNLAALNQFLTSGDLDAFTTTSSMSVQPESLATSPSALNTIPRPSDSIRSAWFTNMEEKDLQERTPTSRAAGAPQPGSPSSTNNEQGNVDADRIGAHEIDEAWRQKVSTKLIPSVFNVVGPLPSIEFLNRCFELYFQRFHALYPIIHRPTFRISGLNQFLVTAMAMHGAVFVGTTASKVQAMNIFRQLNKVVLATWENALARKQKEDLVVTRTAIVGQLFALLSGTPVSLAIFSSFHGAVLAWARQTTILTEFMDDEKYIPRDDMSPKELENLWFEWAVKEQKKRAAMGLHLQDAELASLYHSPPNLRHPGNRHCYACAREVFDAPNAQAWAQAMKLHPPVKATIRQYFSSRSPSSVGTPPHPRDYPLKLMSSPDPADDFSLYIVLIGIQAQVCEARELDQLFTYSNQVEITTLLIEWYHSYQRYQQSNHVTDDVPFCLLILWHSIFVSLFADINEVEIAFGRQGAKTAADHVEKIFAWAETPGAQRAALHVLRIRQLLRRLPLSTVPPVHVPRVAFQSALVFWAFVRMRKAPLTPATTGFVDMSSWVEFSTARVSSRDLLRELQRVREVRGSDQCLGPFSDILHRLGYWGLAEKLGDILDVAIHEDMVRL